MDAVLVPEGFQPLFRTSPALELVGPVYSRGRAPGLVLGLRVQEKHCNARKAMHGGILATLADVALGYNVAFASDPPLLAATISMSIDYAGQAKIDDWLEAVVEVVKRGSRLAFANCYVACESRPVARASAVFFITRGLSPES